VQKAVQSKAISAGHARALLGLPEPEARLAACQRVIEESLSVRQTEALVATGEPTPARARKVRVDEAHGESQRGATVKAPHVLEWETQLQHRCGTPVLIRVKAKERGQIVIDFNTQDELD